MVRWTDSSGTEFRDSSPEFHGGRGQTLAFRRFGVASLLSDLKQAGFASVARVPTVPQLGVLEVDLPGAFIARKG